VHEADDVGSIRGKRKKKGRGEERERGDEEGGGRFDGTVFNRCLIIRILFVPTRTLTCIPGNNASLKGGAEP